MQIHDFEQGSGEWLRARLGKITGTRLKSVMGGKQAQETLMYELIAEQLTGQAEQLWVNQAMQWGTDHEDEAVTEYAKRTKKKPEKIGFCTNKKMPYIGLSPDRLIKKGKKYVGAVEVKCPTTKTAIKYMVEGKVPREYEWQVVHYFLVCEDLKELDFVIYDPRIIKEEKRLCIIPVKRKDVDNQVDEARARLVEFHEKWRETYQIIHDA